MANSGYGHSSAKYTSEYDDQKLRRATSRRHLLMQQEVDRKSAKRGIKSKLQRMLGIQQKKIPAKPLIPKNSGNVFHDQALLQLASVYESLQLGDSRKAVAEVYDVGERLFGRELFERAVRDGGLSGPRR